MAEKEEAASSAATPRGESGRQNTRLVTAPLMSSYYINIILARKLQT